MQICPMDSVIYPWNNQGQIDCFLGCRVDSVGDIFMFLPRRNNQ